MLVPAGSTLQTSRDIAAQVAAKGGGRVELESGGYDWPDETFDLSIYGGGITVCGPNIRAATIRSACWDKAAFLLARPNSSNNCLQDFGLRQNGMARPAEKRPGNFGIANFDGTGYGALVKRVEVLYFGDSAIHFEGATGPTYATQCSLQNCAGYGIEALGGTQNIIIEGGNIQYCWGGVHLFDSFTGLLRGTDIELGDGARHPAILCEGFVGGWQFDSPTVQFAPNADVTIEEGGLVVLRGNCIGNVFMAGASVCHDKRYPNIYLHGHGVANNKFIGGSYEGAGQAESDYLFRIDEARFNSIDVPGPTETYAWGKQAVLEVQGPDVNRTWLQSWIQLVDGRMVKP